MTVNSRAIRLLALAPTLTAALLAFDLFAGLAGTARQREFGQMVSRHERGRELYNFRCYYCHGYSGDARTLAASYLTPPPRDFTAEQAAGLSRETMLDAVTHGRPGTAMTGFTSLLDPAEIELVVDFVQREFIVTRSPNTRYHTARNGWPNSPRNNPATPFASGELALDTPWEELTPAQQAGKRIYLTTCVSCHDRGRVSNEGKHWDLRPLSYPRNNYSHTAPPPPDATSSASPYAIHDRIPRLAGLSAEEKRGETLYQANCAFCHAATGTARNWIGAFMEPHPRDLTSADFMGRIDRAHLRRVIRDGLPDTSMPAWKSVLADDEIDAVITYISRAFHPVADNR